MNEKLLSQKEKMDQIHAIVAQKFAETTSIPGDLMREYNGKTAQYQDMYDSIETMKALVSTDDASENLINQQLNILTVWGQFEADILNRLMQ